MSSARLPGSSAAVSEHRPYGTAWEERPIHRAHGRGRGTRARRYPPRSRQQVGPLGRWIRGRRTGRGRGVTQGPDLVPPPRPSRSTCGMVLCAGREAPRRGDDPDEVIKGTLSVKTLKERPPETANRDRLAGGDLRRSPKRLGRSPSTERYGRLPSLSIEIDAPTADGPLRFAIASDTERAELALEIFEDGGTPGITGLSSKGTGSSKSCAASGGPRPWHSFIAIPQRSGLRMGHLSKEIGTLSSEPRLRSMTPERSRFWTGPASIFKRNRKARRRTRTPFRRK